jgi:GT2 family glycosyltransferase
MKFSVLLPTRNRLDLLSYAIETVRQQDYEDWEIIISDNFSEQDVAGYVQSLNDPRIKYFRTDSFIPVTDNWNNALSKSDGDYIIMLGDDDCLMKGYFSILRTQIKKFCFPDFVYTSAFLYAYPGVRPDAPAGFLVSYNGRSIFQSSSEAFLLSRKKALQFLGYSLNFKVMFDYNMQFFLLSRRIVDAMKVYGPFFQSPYPDYYAANALMLKAQKILVVPKPLVTIGISPKSFGFYYFNNAESSGNAFLKNDPDQALVRQLKKVILPGPDMNTSWLVSMQTLANNFMREVRLKVRYRRYRLIQICAVFSGVILKNPDALQQYPLLKVKMTLRERLFYHLPFLILQKRARPEDNLKLARWAHHFADSHPGVEMPNIDGTFTTILDVFKTIDPLAVVNPVESPKEYSKPVKLLTTACRSVCDVLARTSKLMRALYRIGYVYRHEGIEGIKYRILLLQRNSEFVDKRWAQLRPLAIALEHFAAWKAGLVSRLFPARWFSDKSVSGFLIRLRERRHRKAYGRWVLWERKHLQAQVSEIKTHIDVMMHKPVFAIVVDGASSPYLLEQTLHSLRTQIYSAFNYSVIATANEAPGVRGEYIVMLEAGQLLAPDALYEFANEINKNPTVDIIYGDEDSIDAKNRRYLPFYKPDWSPDYLETFNYIGFPVCFRAELARAGFETCAYDLILKLTEKTSNICHIGKILGHGSKKPGDRSVRSIEEDIRALQGRLSRTGRRGTVRESEIYKGCYDIKIEPKHLPLVSIIIPTAGKTVKVANRSIDLVSNLVGQIRNLSTYTNIEIIVIDNGDLAPRQLQALADAGCTRLTYTDPDVNIPKKLNLGAAAAHGEYLLLLNDDIEIISPSWIERMLEHFEKPHVGVVGAKLLYPNRLIQHVGIVSNFGNPEHVRRLFPGDDPGYFFSTCGVRNYTAVTGACTMTSADLYRKVGGYSPELAVGYNDIDYCMKVRELGLLVVYAPKAELIHMESMSRVPSFNIDETNWYQRRWASKHIFDRFYNELFLAVAPSSFVPHVNRRTL